MNLSLKTLTNWYIWFFAFLSYHPSSLTKCQPWWDLSDGLPSPLLHPRLLNSAREHYTIIPIWDVIHSLFPTSVHPLIVFQNYCLSTRTFSSILWWLLQSSLLFKSPNPLPYYSFISYFPKKIGGMITEILQTLVIPLMNILGFHKYYYFFLSKENFFPPSVATPLTCIPSSAF